MTGQDRFLKEIISLIERAGIAYMIAGSVASSFHGKPRATHDIDVVIDPTPQQLEQFLASIGDDFYVSAHVAREALSQRSMFNVIDVASGWKADCIIRKDRLFSIEEFRRRERTEMLGEVRFLVSPEDAILSKLEWSRPSSSERQYQDALNVAKVRWNQLDHAYLEQWADHLGIHDLLERLKRDVAS